MSDSYEEHKATSGSLSTVAFIFSGLYLFIVNLGFNSLISLQSLIFFVAGMFVAAVVIGIPAYLLQRVVVKVLMKTENDPYTDSSIKKIKFIGIILVLIQISVTFIVTKLAFEWLIIGNGI